MKSRVITETKVVNLELLGGWVILVRTQSSGKHWHSPEEEVTYGVLDSQYCESYPTQELAEARLAEIMINYRSTE